MRIAVIGRTGQLARALGERAGSGGHGVEAVGRPALDLANADDAGVLAALGASFGGHGPQAIINAAAYTAVDRAETEPANAFAINAGGAGAVARAARALAVPMVQISTDYVFAGDQADVYAEHHATAPVNVYGASKLAGEAAVLAAGADAAIVRTGWLYSPFGSNFATTMLRLAATAGTVRVVDDQHGCPTSALDLADVVIAVAVHLAENPAPELRGVFHAAGGGEASRAEFASAIFAAARAAGGPSARVAPISSADFPTAARRPAQSRLDCGRLAAVHGLHLPHWRDSCGGIVARLVREAGGGR